MYISDKDALQYASRMILILVPFLSSLFGAWSWMIELLILFSIFIHSRGSGLRLTVLFMAAGYLSAIIPAGGQSLSQIGFAPWAGILYLGLKEKGLGTAQCMFWALMLAALVSALPVIPGVKTALQPENLQEKMNSALAFYEQQGTLAALEKQGMTSAEFEGYLKKALPVYYMLMPAMAGIIGMLELGLAFLAYRFAIRKIQKTTPFLFWRLPWYAVWVAIIGLAAYLGGDFIQNKSMEIIGLNLMVLMAAISLIMGLSCLSYLFKHPKIPKLLVWAIVFAGVFFPYYVIIGLVFLGLFDLVLNIRRIPEKNEGGKL